MAKTDVTGVWKNMRGRVGDVVFRRDERGLVLSDRPKKRDPARVLSPAEQTHRIRFLAAVAYAKSVLADPVRRLFYAGLAKARRTPIFGVLVGDFMKPPMITDLDLSHYRGQTGDVIEIHATDDVQVDRVLITIKSHLGEEIETGPAVFVDYRWVYEATATAPAGGMPTVEAVAIDRPNHRAMATGQPTP